MPSRFGKKQLVLGSLLVGLILAGGFFLTETSEAGPGPNSCHHLEDAITTYYNTWHREIPVGGKRIFGCGSTQPPLVWGNTSAGYHSTVCAPCEFDY